jgi:hypothetical protein
MTMSRALCTIFLLGSSALPGCGPERAGYDAEASAAFRAAWEKRRAGDEAGYRAGLTALAKRRDTWAGQRAALDLELADDPGGGSTFTRLLKQAAETFRKRTDPAAPHDGVFDPRTGRDIQEQ